jgi:hypothetical protein
MDPERVLAGDREGVGLLGDDRADDDLAGVHQATSSATGPRETALPARSVSRAGRRGTRDDEARGADDVGHPRATGADGHAGEVAEGLRDVQLVLGQHQEDAAAETAVEERTRLLGRRRPEDAGVDELTVPRSAWIDSAERNAARRALRLTFTV